MHRGPLWQFFFATFMVLFTAQRGAIAWLALRDDPSDVLGIAYLLQAIVGAIVAAGIWTGRRWVLGPVVVLGALGVVTALVGGLGGIGSAADGTSASLPSAVGGAAASVLLAGGLFILLHAEFRPGERNPERAARSANLPDARSRPE